MENKTLSIKKFNPLSVSSKFAICGLPLRMDTYKYCTFGCKYCFANNRKIMEFDKHIQIGNISWLEKKLEKVHSHGAKMNDFLETLIEKNITFHCGGMSDPFQPCEKEYGITKSCINVCTKYNHSILFSTKSDTVYDANIRPDIHTFQLSITGAGNDLEPNVPSLQKRIKFYRQLKNDGFKVGIRIQPFIPNITTIDIIKEFHDADNITIEGIKIVPQNEELKNIMFEQFGMKREWFTQMGLLNLKPQIRLKLYQPFIEYLESNNIPYSIADNDMHHLGTNYCCCGDNLITNILKINNTTMCHLYGNEYAKEVIDEMIFNEGVRDCKCNQLFTSNRQEGCVSVQDFYDKRFYRKSSPFSTKFLYTEEQ